MKNKREVVLLKLFFLNNKYIRSFIGL